MLGPAARRSPVAVVRRAVALASALALSVTWASSNPGVATVDGSGLVAGVSQGDATISATSEGKTGSAAVAVVRQPPPGSPDPTLLPRAALQAPDLTAYTALNLPARPAGYSYPDPVTHVKIWKVTSNTRSHDE